MLPTGPLPPPPRTRCGPPPRTTSPRTSGPRLTSPPETCPTPPPASSCAAPCPITWGWVAGKTDAMAFATINPATGKTEKEFPSHTPEEVEALLQRAVVAFAEYKTTTYAERARHLLTAAELLEGEVPDIARILTTEMGKKFAAAKEIGRAHV